MKKNGNNDEMDDTHREKPGNGKKMRITLNPSSSSLYENLLMERRGRDPMIYYEFVKSLGEGSMGSVCKVRKRDDSGSARPGFVLQPGGSQFSWSKLCSCLSWWCCGIDDEDDDENYNYPYGYRMNNLRKVKKSTERQSFGGNNDIDIINSERSKTDIDLDDDASQNRLPQDELSSLIRFGPTDKYFALKSIHLSKARNSALREELKNEVTILKTLDHPVSFRIMCLILCYFDYTFSLQMMEFQNIVRLVETFAYKYSLYVVLELCSGGDLYSRDPYSECDAARISNSILRAIAYLHQQGISHRDLKYENIMFVTSHPMADVKLIDFGLSKKYGCQGANNINGSGSMHDTVGTMYSISPEVLQGSYTQQADLWSCGVLIFMLLSSTMPFYGKTNEILMQRILRGKYEFLSSRWIAVSAEAKSLVQSLLQYQANNRPTAEQALQDPWFLNISKQGGRHRKQTSSNIPETMDSVQASIENFANHSRLKKLALMVMAHRSTSDEIEILRRMFKKYDNSRGYFTLEGFKKALRDYLYTDAELERIFKGMDIDGNGTVHYFEFLAASMEAHGFINEQQIADAFDRLDADDSGTISAKDLKSLLGKGMSDTIISLIIDEEDMDVNRAIDYSEFLKMWDMHSDSIRKKTLQNVARRRVVHKPSHIPVKKRNATATGIILESERCDISTCDIDLDELEEEIGDQAFQARKGLSTKCASFSSTRSISSQTWMDD
jgi:calcium-dependent protein kinase